MDQMLDDNIEIEISDRWPDTTHPKSSPVHRSRRQAVAAHVIAEYISARNGGHLAGLLSQLIRSGIIMVNGNPGPVPMGVPNLASTDAQALGGRYEIVGRFIVGRYIAEAEGEMKRAFAEILPSAETRAAHLVAKANAADRLASALHLSLPYVRAAIGVGGPARTIAAAGEHALELTASVSAFAASLPETTAAQTTLSAPDPRLEFVTLMAGVLRSTLELADARRLDLIAANVAKGSRGVPPDLDATTHAAQICDAARLILEQSDQISQTLE